MLVSNQRGWSRAPDWPPNLFLVTSLLLERLDLHRVWDPLDQDFRERIDQAQRIGTCWRGPDWMLKPRTADARRCRRWLDERWRELLARFGSLPLDGRLSASDESGLGLLLLVLTAVADEASLGAGFTFADHDPECESSWVAEMIAAVSVKYGQEAGQARRLSTLALGESKIVAAVMPKARTPTVGCTVRSLTHHLALVPPATQIESLWRMEPPRNSSAGDASGFNLLCVPFPYAIEPGQFRSEHLSGDERWDFFGLSPGWLPGPEAGDAGIDTFCTWLDDLIGVADREGPVHGVVLPELALNDAVFEALAERIARRPHLELLLSGVIGERRNCLRARVYHRDDFGQTPRSVGFVQHKHHRWKLDRSQIRNYGLAGVLSGADSYWEHMRIEPRSVNFHPFRHDSVLCCLICEDLARIDPCQTVVRAVGPNLLIALLMDGPQTRGRWSARYATVLADDPGCSVLSLTSLAPLRLNERGGFAPNRTVALWKSADQGVRELALPDDAQALLLCLHRERDGTEMSLDGRDGGTEAVRWQLENALPVRMKDVPGWLASGPGKP